MSDLKIMFWNIHNVYSYKVHWLKPDDEAASPAEAGDQAQEAKTETGGESPAGEDSKKDEPQRIERLFRVRKREISQIVSGVIRKIDPDIVVLVESSLGKYELITEEDQQPATGEEASNAQPSEEDVAANQEKPKSDNDQQVTFFDRFGPYQYQEDLNRLYKADGLRRSWSAQMLAVDASDLFDEESPEKLTFELYGILWDQAKVKAEEHLSTETRGKTGKLVFKPRSPAATLFSLKDQPQQKFTLFMFHAPQKKKEAAGEATKENVASNKPVQKESAVETNKSEKDERVTAIKNLSELKRIDEAVHGSQKIPLIIAGSFDLDRDAEGEKDGYDPLLKNLGLKARIDGKTEFAKKTDEKKPEPAQDEGEVKPEEENTDQPELTKACDNIFTLNFEESDTQEKSGAIYNFVKEDCGNAVDQALSVSNHLPIHVTVRLK